MAVEVTKTSTTERKAGGCKYTRVISSKGIVNEDRVLIQINKYGYESLGLFSLSKENAEELHKHLGELLAVEEG